MRPSTRLIICLWGLCCLAVPVWPAAAQTSAPAEPQAGRDGQTQAPAPDPHAGHVMPGAEPAPPDPQAPQTEDTGWTTAFDANAFFGFNYQRRYFRDFHEVESQNWLMATARRGFGRTALSLESMWSLEPFTIQDLGSPQVFQTGETFEGAPLIDYQHPHDLFMGLGGNVIRTMGRARTRLDLSIVGSPAIGPPVFMHRPSADDNPQAPLSHHNMDSTHITHGVVTGGLNFGAIGLEASWFHGREPDEDRLDLDMGRLDSWAVRGSFTSGPWSAQVSGARLHEPETIHPDDVTRLTASIAYTGMLFNRSAALLAVWGQNREVFGLFDAVLVEGRVAVSERNAIYWRGERVVKSILGGGIHPTGFIHQHPHSRIGALTGGYVRDIGTAPYGRFGVGADITAYRVPGNLKAFYGSPVSFHVFMRYRRNPTAGAHVHH